MLSRFVLLAPALVLAPLGANAADLVVWWEKGLYAQEDEAVAETIAAFEQGTGKQVELTYFPLPELPDRVEAALEAGRPPDFAFGLLLYSHVAQWAFDDRLVDLSDAIGHFSDLFDSDALDRAMPLNARTGQRALYGLPIGRSSDHIFVWRSLWSAQASRWTTFRKSGRRSGRSGAIRCSRRCAKPWAATTSGASACRCRRKPPTRWSRLTSSGSFTAQTTSRAMAGW